MDSKLVTGMRRRLIKDYRNYSFHRTFGAVNKGALDVALDYDAGLTMPDQVAEGILYGCTGITTAELGTDFDRVAYNGLYTYEKTCLMEGHGMNKGCYIYNSLKSATVYGLQAIGDDNASDAEELRNRRGKAFEVEKVDGYDWFDSLRSALILNPHRSISIGTPWLKEWDVMGIDHTGIAPLDFKLTGEEGWHNWKICGIVFKDGEWMLKAKAWQGPQYGDKGFTYYRRATINKVMAIRGTEAWTQAKATDADIRTIKINILETALSFVQRMIRELLERPAAPAVVQPKPVPPVKPEQVIERPPKPVPPAPPKYLFDTVQNARHSIRVICDEMNLTLYQKNVITACIEQESGFKNWAVNKNIRNGKVSSTDWGICQINDTPGWHIGPGLTFPSVEFLLAHPEDAVRYMVRMMRAGKLDLWVSYSSGAYLKYMPLR